MGAKIDRRAETEMEALLDKLIVQKVQNGVKEDLGTQKTQLDKLEQSCREGFNKTQQISSQIQEIRNRIGSSDYDETLMDKLEAVQDDLEKLCDSTATGEQLQKKAEEIRKELNKVLDVLTEKTGGVQEDVDNVRKLAECLLHGSQKAQDSIVQTVREVFGQEETILRESTDLMTAQIQTLKNVSENQHEEGLALVKQRAGDLEQRLNRQAEQIRSLADGLAHRQTQSTHFEAELLKRLDNMADAETAMDESSRQRFEALSHAYDQRLDLLSKAFEQKMSLARMVAVIFGVVEGIQFLLLLLHIFL